MPKKAKASPVKKQNYIFWFCSFATASIWIVLIFLNTRNLDISKHPAEVNAADQELAVKPWRDRVVKLEASLAEMQQALKERDDRLAQLTKVHPEAGSQIPRSGPDVAAPRNMGTLLSRSGKETAYRDSVGQPTTTPSPDPTKTLGDIRCFFQDDLDYLASGKEDVIENLSPEQCCEVCASRSREGVTCAVAVISSINDRPPLACWLKEKVSVAMNKIGVKACWPPGHPPIPPPPAPGQQLPLGAGAASAGRVDRAEHLTSLAGLTGWQRSTLLKRADAIRAAVKHAWSNYREHAWGMDELRPVAGAGKESKFRHAVTMVDSLDTLWITGLKDEFRDAKQWLVQNLPSRLAQLSPAASLFETHIRTFGGLLSAYDLSKDVAFLNLAMPLANRINQAVNQQGIAPYTFGGGRGGMGCNSIVESGTLQLEMRYLSHVTGDPSFSSRVDRFYESIRRHDSLDGLFPNCFMTGRGKITFGADGDSFYEYLAKVWLQGGKKDAELFKMYETAVGGLETHLVSKGDPKAGEDDLTFLSVFFWNGKASGTQGRLDHEMEHLTCFVPGWIALGLQDFAEEKRARLRKLAEELAFTCWKMYQRQPTGIGPERVKRKKVDLSMTDTREYILRPEAAEGWWYMHELVPDPKYREWGWETFVAFEKTLWVEHGYASIKDVTRRAPTYIDRMESFFLAETLKYLFLLQDPEHDIHLDSYIFNTEAHPLSIFSRAPVRSALS